MKKALLFLAMFLALASVCQAAGTVTCTGFKSIYVIGEKSRAEITCTATADAAAGTFPNATIDLNSFPTQVAGYFLYQVDVDPDNAAVPSALTVNVYRYADYLANTTNALSLCAASGVSATLTSSTLCVPSSSVGYSWPGENVTLVISQAGNTPNSSKASIKLKFTSN